MKLPPAFVGRRLGDIKLEKDFSLKLIAIKHYDRDEEKGYLRMELLEEVSDDFVVNANDVFILFGKRNRFRVLSRNWAGKFGFFKLFVLNFQTLFGFICIIHIFAERRSMFDTYIKTPLLTTWCKTISIYSANWTMNWSRNWVYSNIVRAYHSVSGISSII